ncbi:MAG TPA: SGNH/GDSL hydrolase family protein [Phototrophicaceae bacterium]|nr:SGNH/GDSL hydrolase family protein [Phototrophicaceae bacterium]
MNKRWIRWLGLGILTVALAILGVTAIRGTQPAIEFYTADRLAVDYPGVEAGMEAVKMSWKAVNVSGENFMRMESWVNERWVLIGEHFAPEKSDRIVVSHPLRFAHPLYRLTILNGRGEIINERRLELSYAETETTPEIIQFIAPVRGGVARNALKQGDLNVPVLWHIEQRNYDQQPIIEQVTMPAGEVIGTPLGDLETWQPRAGEGYIRLAPVDGDTVFLRLRVVDTGSKQTLTENLITLPVVQNSNDEAVPALTPLDAATLGHMREIYAAGQAQGNQPHRLMKIGDSNIAGDSALCNFGWGNYDLGAYGDLQPTIDRFQDSFCAASAAAGRSFSAASVFDPTWATDKNCRANEAPLDCAIREEHPAYALLYLGVQDLERMTWNQTLSPDSYRENLRQMVATLAENGIIPILTTFPTGYTFHNDGSADSLNTMIVQLADEEHLPLIDLRASTALYSNRGVDVDGFHMSTPPGGKTLFTGNESLYARTLYELRVLEMLHQLEAAVGGG